MVSVGAVPKPVIRPAVRLRTGCCSCRLQPSVTALVKSSPPICDFAKSCHPLHHWAPAGAFQRCWDLCQWGMSKRVLVGAQRAGGWSLVLEIAEKLERRPPGIAGSGAALCPLTEVRNGRAWHGGSHGTDLAVIRGAGGHWAEAGGLRARS